MGSIIIDTNTPKGFPSPSPVSELSDLNVAKNFEINMTFLRLILQEEVESFNVTPGTTLGDNYMSIIYAVEVHIRGRNKPRHILIKCYPTQLGRREYVDSADIFGTEFFFYNEWAPKLAELAGDNPALRLCLPEFLGGNRAGVGRSRTGAVKYPEPWTNENFIVMTDLRKEQGFKMANRLEGVNADHAILIVQQLGTLHALSWVFKVLQGVDKLSTIYPDMMDKTYGGSTNINEGFKPLMEHVASIIMGHVESEFGQDSRIYQGVKKIYSGDTMDILKKFVSHNGIVEEDMEKLLRVRDDSVTNLVKEPWLVSVHGDCWVNNVMFDYSTQDGNPKEVVMLDFQMTHEACPTTDLAYFLYSSTTTKTRVEESEILRAYYNQFMLVCDTLNCKPLPDFSWATLKRRFRRAKIFGFLMGTVLLNVILKPPEEAVDLDSLNADVDIGEAFSNAMKGGENNLALKGRVLALTQEFYDEGII